MLSFLALLYLPAEIEAINAPGFTKEQQVAAVRGTVRIVNRGQNFEGSGALIGRIGPLGYVLTANHVVAGAERVDVELFSARSYPRPEEVIPSDVIARAPDIDLALVEVPLRNLPPGMIRVCPLASRPVEQAFAALSVGCTDGKAPECRTERVTGNKQIRRPDAATAAWVWQAEQASIRGRSGGPLIDTKGFLIGVCSGTGKERGYYSHLDEVHAFLKRNGHKRLMEDAKQP